MNDSEKLNVSHSDNTSWVGNGNYRQLLSYPQLDLELAAAGLERVPGTCVAEKRGLPSDVPVVVWKLKEIC